MSGEPTSVPQIIRASIYFVPTITKHWSECFTCILFIPHPTLYFSHQGSDSKEFAYNAGDLGLVPGSGRSLEEGMATHSRILAWRIPWTAEPGRLLSMGSKRVRHDWATSLSLSDNKEFACNAGDQGSIPGLGRSSEEGNGNPLQYPCPEKFHGQRNLGDYSPWDHKESDRT